MSREKLRHIIADRRKHKGLSIEALAELVHCSPLELKGYEIGLLAMRANILHALFHHLGIGPDELHPLLGEQALQALLAEAQRSEERWRRK